MIKKILTTYQNKEGHVWVDMDSELKIFGITHETVIKPKEFFLEHTQVSPNRYEVFKADYDDYIENSYKIIAADSTLELEGIQTWPEYLANKKFPIKDETTENDKNTLKMFQSIYIDGYMQSEKEKL